MTSDEYVTVRSDGSLHVERVQLNDAGDYTCLAENAVGATNHTTTVHVHGNNDRHHTHLYDVGVELGLKILDRGYMTTSS